MKSVSVLCVLVVIFVMEHHSDAREICRCDNYSGIGGGFRTGKATNQCGLRGFYCYNYARNPYCEVGDRKSDFQQCCIEYGVGMVGIPVVGIKCQDI